MKFSQLGDTVHTSASPCAVELSSSFSNTVSLRAVGVSQASIFSLALSYQSSVFVRNVLWGLGMDMEASSHYWEYLRLVMEHFPLSHVAV